jgi:phage terminase Nu1 subunit (DNA packaging protein)
MLTRTARACAEVALSKLSSGRQITEREQELLERLDAERSGSKPPERLYATLSDFSEIIGVKLRALSKLVKQGLPVRDGMVFLPEAVQWWARRGGMTLKDAQAHYWRAKERMMRLKERQTRRGLVTQREVVAAVDAAVKLLSTHLLRLPKMLEPHVGQEAAAKADREIRAMMEAVAAAAKSEQ